jgi:hypothetical protein
MPNLIGDETTQSIQFIEKYDHAPHYLEEEGL